jgi:hypothetical protein
MMGCLTAPFKLVGCLGLLALLVLGWLYRDLAEREGRHLLDRLRGAAAPASAASARGRPSARALASAASKVDSLNGWRADSVVLTPSEVASLMGARLAPQFRKELDSLQVELLDGEVALRGRLRTARLPQDVVGPLAMALRPNEPIQAIGPLRVTGPGVGEWAVRSLRIRDIPLPAGAVKRLVGRALDEPGRETVPWRVPAGVRAVRARPSGLTLYGAPRP